MMTKSHKVRPRLVFTAVYALFLHIVVLNSAFGSNSDTENNIQFSPKTKDNFQKNSTRTAVNYQEPEGDSCLIPSKAKALLILLNESRSKANKCERKKFPASQPLTIGCSLSNMAQMHAQDMAQRNVLSHTSSDGSDITSRAQNSNISWSALAENVASGHHSAESVHQSWMDSTRHCENILNPRYTQIGVGQSEGYWSLTFLAD